MLIINFTNDMVVMQIMKYYPPMLSLLSAIISGKWQYGVRATGRVIINVGALIYFYCNYKGHVSLLEDIINFTSLIINSLS